MPKYLNKQQFRGKTVFLRLDLNVPLTNKHSVGDDFRLQASLPTIHYLVKAGAKIIIGSHLGRPKGKDEDFSLRPVAERLAKLLKYPFISTDIDMKERPFAHLVFYTGDITKHASQKQIAKFFSKDIVVLENLRFYPGEEANDKTFTKILAGLADFYVNDAFAVSHRVASSIVGVPELLPSFCGLNLEQEIKYLSVLLKKPAKPFVLMMGGIKISDKAKTLQYLGEKAQHILLGGGLANLLLVSRGYSIGASNVEKESLKLAASIDKNFKDKIILPSDLVVATNPQNGIGIRTCNLEDVKPKEKIVDFGPKTILNFSTYLKTAKTIVWNGPLGLFEVKPFDTSTMALAKIVGSVGKRKAYTVVGGGETVDAIRESGQENHLDHLSTGGGAMLEFLSGKELPGIKALK